MREIKGARAVVLGGAGFVGSHLCERLLGEGALVTCVDSFITGRRENMRPLGAYPTFHFIEHDITQPIEIQGPVDYVFNLASPASPIDYAKLPLETMRVGSLGTEHALMLAKKKGSVMLQASTSEIYGDPLVHPQREDYFGNVDPTGPRAVYDEAKRYGEAIVSAYRRSFGVKTRIARIFNTYGPRMRLDDGRVVPAFISQALTGQDFTVFGDGSQTRSFCFVRDLVDGLLRLALSDVADPVNLGNPVEMTMLQFAEAVRAAAGGGGKIVHQPLPQGDPKQRRPDITRARTLLGWEPQVPLAVGLEETITWFRADLPKR
ncbi:MAG TPA: UDP-glucuronic acid decarboxylase family protein [Myxococcaceae bacterium]|jgi:dTDP-glucose 4,6-dehydratase